MRTIACLVGLFLAAAPAAGQTLADAPRQPMPSLTAKTLVAELVACVDRPTTSVPTTALVVLRPHAADAHDISARHHLVVLNAGTTEGLLAGQQFFTRRLMPPVNGEPVTPLTPGAIRTTGWLTVVAADAEFALGRIDYACTAIEPNDYLEPYVAPMLPTVIAADGPTDFATLGRVLFGVDRRESFGAGDLLSIDSGSADGLVPGARVGFYRDAGDGLPLVEIGSGIVLEVAAETSKVVIERSNQDVNRGDYVGVRGRPAP